MKNKTEVQLNKVITHNWTILCSNTSIDETSHNISLFNIIETLGLELSIDEVQEKEKDQKGWYSVPFNFWLVTKLQKPNIDLDLMFELKYKVIDPDGKQIGKEFGPSIKFGKGTDSLRVRNQIGTFPITKSGFYRIVASMSQVGLGKFEDIGETMFKANVNVKKNDKKSK